MPDAVHPSDDEAHPIGDLAPPPQTVLMRRDADADDDRPGGRLGDYRLIARLASARAEAIWEAAHITFGQAVEVHVVAPPEPAAARVRKDAESLSKLRDPHVVVCHGCGDDRGRVWLAFEPHRGRDARAALAQHGGPLPQEQALAVIAGAARGLQALHALGVLHRGMAPESIIVGDDHVARLGAPMLLADQEAPRRASDPETVVFRAPERTRDDARPDGRADIYGLGAVLFYLLTGQPPFAAANATAAVEAVRVVPPIDPRTISPDVSAECARIVLKAMAKDVDDRYADAGALIVDVEHVLKGEDPTYATPESVSGSRTPTTERAKTSGSARLRPQPAAPADTPLTRDTTTVFGFRAKSEAPEAKRSGTAVIVRKTTDRTRKRPTTARLSDALAPSADEAKPGSEAKRKPTTADEPTGGFQMLPDDEQVGNYRLLFKLGEGGMGTIYKAAHVSTGQEVALKVIGGKNGEKLENLEMALREASVAATIRHPNVITCYGVGQDRGRLFMALELMGRGDAKAYIQQCGGKLTEQQAVKLVIDGARGLQAIHKAGFLHRDIKPGNIFLAADGTAKLGDLGLAHAAKDASTPDARGVALTPAFMSPEITQGVADLDGRSDVYSLGASLFYLLTNEIPFHASSTVELIEQVLHAPPIDPRSLNPAVSEFCAKVVLKAMAKNRDERYESATLLLEDLLRLRAGDPPSHALGLAPAEVGGVSRIGGASRVVGAVSRMAGGVSRTAMPATVGDGEAPALVVGTATGERQAVIMSGGASGKRGMVMRAASLSGSRAAVSGSRAAAQAVGAVPAGVPSGAARDAASSGRMPVARPRSEPVLAAAQPTPPRTLGDRGVRALAGVGAFAVLALAAIGAQSLVGRLGSAAPPARVAAAAGLPADGYEIAWRDDELVPLTAVGAARIDGAKLTLGPGARLVGERAAPLDRALASAGDWSVELTIAPADLGQQQARIVTLARSAVLRDFALSQCGTRLEARVRTTATSSNGLRPHLVSPEGTLTGGRQHVVFVRRGGHHELWVDGNMIAEAAVPGTLAPWDEASALVVGDDPDGGCGWRGEIAGLRFHARALDAADIAKRVAAAK